MIPLLRIQMSRNGRRLDGNKARSGNVDQQPNERRRGSNNDAFPMSMSKR